METSCGLILVNFDSILLLQYPQGHWDFPKGHSEESDADHRATASRELAEETGIDDIRINRTFKIRTEYSYHHKGRKRIKEVHWFLGETDQIEVTLSHEHQNYLWLEWDEAEQQLTFESAQNVLRQARKHHSAMLN